MLSSSAVFHFAFLCILHHNHGFKQLSWDLAPTDILDEVVNQIFSSLQFKTNRISKLKEYSKMHKYFVSVARLRKTNWMEVLKITSPDINIDNGTTDYTTVINEILNEENKTEAVSDTLNEENVNKHIEDFLGTLERVKDLYLRNHPLITVNYEILHRFHKNRHSLRNRTVDKLHGIKDDSDFWVPDGRRIYQGKRTKIKHFPFVASIHTFDQFSCAGSIIDADLVITAASCLQLAHNNRFYRENPNFLSVRIGSSSYTGGDHVPVLEVYFYPSYDPKTLRNNLAILRLARVIKFHKRNKNVKKIRVDTNARALPSNTDGITIIGWGARTASNKIYNPWKNKLAMDVLYFYGLADCRDVYSKAFVTKKNFCAGFISHGGGACNRDVGAPGVVNGILTGVVSFGSVNCGAHDSPTVFTKLGYYIDWIEDIMAQDPPKHSVRITTRQPHLFHTIMSTPPLHDTNFLIEPIDLSKVPDVRDLDVRMPKEDKNEFLNSEFNHEKSDLKETFPISKQIIKQQPRDPNEFVDITRLRDEKKSSPGTIYEPPRLNPIYTIMSDFDEAGNGKIPKKSTIAELLAQTKQLRDAKPQWQIDLEHVQKSESAEDTTEIPGDTRESVDTYKFELNTLPSNGMDKRNKEKIDDTDVEKILSSDNYDDNNETVAVQQSLPIQTISEEKGLSIETSEKTIVTKKKDEDGHKVKQPIKSPKEEELDREIDKFIENLNFEEIINSEEGEELKRKAITDRKLPKPHKNQKSKSVSVNHKISSQKDRKIKPTQKNYDMFPLRDPALTNDDRLRESLQDQKTQPALTNYYLYPKQYQETELASTNDDMFAIQDRKTKPPPKKIHTIPQDEETKPALNNDDVFPQQDQERQPATTNDYLYPQQDQQTKRPQKNYYTFPLQDGEREPTNDDIFLPQTKEATHNFEPPLQDQSANAARMDSNVLPLRKQDPKPAPKGDDLITLLYLTADERKPENLKDLAFKNIQKDSSAILSMGVLMDVIAEELRKKE